MSNGSTGNGSTNGMRTDVVYALVIYLVLFAVLSGYSVYTLWSLHCPTNKPCPADRQSQTTPVEGSQNSQTAAPTTNAPNATGGANSPAANSTPTSANAAKPAGQGASPGQAGAAPASNSSTNAATPSANAANQTGSQNQTQSTTNESIYHNWSWLWLGPWEISAEARLYLLVLLMGALGSSVYALKSIGDYRGANKLLGSWTVFYLIQPFEGSGIAILMYLVVRGGFLGTGSTSDSINVFGMCAIAGLSGAFSDTAFMKLNEVFDTLFKPKDSRGGKIDDLVISTSSLPDGTVNAAYGPVSLKADNGVGALTWSVAPPLPLDVTLDFKTGVISGTPKTAQAATVHVFTVKDSATPPSCATKSLSLTVH